MGHRIRLCLSIMMCMQPLSAGVILNEIMTNPAGDENSREFVEIINASSDSLSLDSLFFGDAADLDLIHFLRGSSVLPPGAIALIIDPDADDEFIQSLPATVLLLSISDSRFASYGLSNSSEKLYYLYRNSICLDSCLVPVLPEDRSWARLSGDSPDWQLSERSGGSPGQPNFQPLFDVDLQLKVESGIAHRRGWDLELTLFNRGALPAAAGTVLLQISPGYPHLEPSVEMVFDLSALSPILSGDSLRTGLSGAWPRLGQQLFTVISVLDSDENRSNDRDSILLGYIPPDMLVINEFSAVPGTLFPSEFVELFWRDSLALSLSGLQFGDAVSAIPLPQAQPLSPGEILLLLPENAGKDYDEKLPVLELQDWPNLNNSADSLRILDWDGNRLQTLHYQSGWYSDEAGSYERRNPLLSAELEHNWYASIQGSPGLPNSSLVPDFFLEYESIRQKYLPGPEPAVILQLPLLNFGLKEIRDPLFKVLLDLNLDGYYQTNETMFDAVWHTSLPVGSSGLFRYSLNLLHPGLNPCRIEDRRGKGAETDILVPDSGSGIRINEIMPLPLSGQSEWIEVYNAGTETWYAALYGISDASATVILPRGNFSLEAGEYAVISADPELLQDYTGTENVKLLVAEIPNLNNTWDRICLRDVLGQILDSVTYNEYSNLQTGISLERLNDSLWLPSQDSSGSSPGRMNSVNQDRYRVSIDRIRSETESIANQNLTLYAFNSGYYPLPDLRLSVLLNKRVLADTLLNDLAAGDSVILSRSFPPDLLEGRFTVLTAALSPYSYSLDSLHLFKSYASSPAGLNEILCIPSDWNEIPEAIEIYCEDPLLDLSAWHVQGDGFSIALPAGQGAHYRILCASELNSSQKLYPPLASMPRLRNTGDIILLLDPAGKVMDSVNTIGHRELLEGISLEKNNQSSRKAAASGWGRSLHPEGHSLMQVNSRESASDHLDVLQILPPYLDTMLASAGLLFKVQSSTGIRSVILHIIDLRGRRIHRLRQDLFSSQELALHWDGLDQLGQTPPPGLYICLLEIIDLHGKNKRLIESFAIL